MHNTFTYRHSELPSIPPEIQAEIVALDVQISDLILKSQGNYRALEQLAEILDNCLDSCELNLSSIRIIPDDSLQPAASAGLPIQEQIAIFGTVLFNSMLLGALKDTGIPQLNDLCSEVTRECYQTMAKLSNEKVTAALADSLAKSIEGSEQQTFNVSLSI